MKKIITAFSCLLISNLGMSQSNTLFDQDQLNGKDGFEILREQGSREFSDNVRFVGDVNNDGIDDIGISDYAFQKEQGDSLLDYVGEAYIIFGSANGFPATFDAGSLDGNNGFVVEGVNENDRCGNVIEGLGDVNGDGIDDLLVMTKKDTISVIYGQNESFPARMTRHDIDGSNGFLIVLPDQSDYLYERAYAQDVNCAGDINNDGNPDIVIGVGGFFIEEAWVIFGKNENFPAEVKRLYLNGINGFRINCDYEGSRPAYFVGPLGDVNGDNIDDFYIGSWIDSYETSDKRITYVVFGKSSPFSDFFSVNDLSSDGGIVIGNSDANFLVYMGGLGDINGDGIDDFYSGTHVIYGSASGFPSFLAVDSMTVNEGFRRPGSFICAGIGDFNEDGIDDFIAQDNGWMGGENAHVIFGSVDGFPIQFTSEDINGKNGFTIQNEIRNTGRPLDGGGDINGDGIPDVILGDITNDRAMVIFGGATLVTSVTDDLPKEQWTMYPNPVNAGTVSINCMSCREKIVHLRIYDMQGALKYTSDVFQEGALDVSSWKPGLYYVHIGPDQVSKMVVY